MMRALDLIHRWTGGLIGLLLAVLGLSGALLVHKDAWLRWTVPHATDAQLTDVATLGAVTAKLLAAPERPASILYASESLGLHKLTYADGRGAYADQAGELVERWSSTWDRPELWLFDLHHHLLNGGTGETVAGVAGLVGLGFVLTGLILWWRTRRTFSFRLWPKRMSRPSIVRHHRDLGVVAAPLLLLSMLTGVTMVLRPVADVLLSPFSPPGTVAAALAPPKLEAGPLDLRAIDWTRVIADARARFPGAELRVVSLPRKPGDPISIRFRQPAEWLPNGRTTLWLDPSSGRLLASRDALAMPLGARLFNDAYPLHAAKIGGLAYRLLMTCSGLALAMLGGLAVGTFWTERGRRWRSEARARRLSTAEARAG